MANENETLFVPYYAFNIELSLHVNDILKIQFLFDNLMDNFIR